MRIERMGSQGVKGFGVGGRGFGLQRTGVLAGPSTRNDATTAERAWCQRRCSGFFGFEIGDRVCQPGRCDISKRDFFS